MVARVMTEPSAVVLADGARPGDLLGPEELQRADRFRRQQDRDDFVAAHVLVRHCVGRLLGIEPASVRIEQRCQVCGGPHGRPTLPDHPEVGVSLAHSAGWVAAAAGEGRIGVDLESRRTPLDLGPRLLDGVLGTAELAWLDADRPGAPERFLRLWVRKEAAVKAGLGELDALEELEVVVAGGPAPRLAGLTVTGWEDEQTIGACVSVGAPRWEPFVGP